LTRYFDKPTSAVWIEHWLVAYRHLQDDSVYHTMPMCHHYYY